MIRFLILLAVLAGTSLAQQQVDYVREVAPIFRERCVGCHGPGQQMNGLRLDQKSAALAGGYSGPVIVTGKPAESKLLKHVQGEKGVAPMPPVGPRLTPEQIRTLSTWIEQGAPWPEEPTASAAVRPGSSHWAFQPVRRPEVPKVKDLAWSSNPIDAFVLARLEAENLRPSKEADRTTLLRRVHLDLTGILPSRDELRAFLADDRAAAYDRVVDRLLASPHFGERWARPWLDRARYADSDGYEKDWVRPHAWRYRRWVIQALNRDMPFDRFSIQQIAGDLLPEAAVEQKVATGFHRQTLTNREGGIDNEQFEFEATVDRTNTVASTWLGLTMGCAQCHDHKYDPLSQKDYYQLFAFFEDLAEVEIDAPLPGEIGPYLRDRDEYQGKREALLKEYDVAALQNAWEGDMLEAAAHPGKRTDWDLAWDCLLKLTEGGDGEKIIRIAPEKRSARQRDILVDHFVRNYHFAVGQKQYKALKMDELDRKLRELKEKYPQLSQAMTVEEEPGDGKWFLRVRGDYETKGIPVKRAAPAVLPAVAGSSRLDLARWIVSRENPLTPRVTVNWIWQELFGRGLVKSVDDFGTRGDAPSHPELLDYMARKFMDEGWSIKKTIRRIVTSKTYRQASLARPDVDARDPENRLLARQTRLRLPAELIRDAALAASGLLTHEIGGRSIRPPQPSGVASLGYGKKDDSAWKETTGPERYGRGLYIQMQRSTPYPLLVNFDAPKSVVAQCRRERSNTPLQALNLLNDPVFMEAATALAYQVLLNSPASFRDRVQHLFQRALTRSATEVEISRFHSAYGRLTRIYEADPQAARKLAPARFSGYSQTEIAAWSALASAILNLDEFITRE